MGQEGSSRTSVQDFSRLIVVHATSKGIDPAGQTAVVIYWNSRPGIVGYNLYRHLAESEERAGKPLNDTGPIAPVSTCAELEAIVPQGSAEWEMLENAFASVATSQALQVVDDGRGLGALDLEEMGKVAGSIPGRLLRTVGAPSPGIMLQAVSLCDVFDRGLREEEEAIFEMMANSNLKLRLARGLAFVDESVTVGCAYVYELRGVQEDGTEVQWADAEVAVTAGTFSLTDPPSGFALTPGDCQVLATWNRNPYAFGYILQRGITANGPFQVIHEEAIVYDITTDLNGNPLPAPKPGFVDYRRWDAEGQPIDHEVNGVDIEGPQNNVTYYYQIASLDILGRQGPWSSSESAMPIDSTPPMAPTNLRIDASTSPRGLSLSWRKVRRDVKGHRELDLLHTYRIYRAETMEELEDLATLHNYEVGTCTANPFSPSNMTLVWLDTDPVLTPPFGEQDFWYRVRCVDANGNVSAPSAVLSGRLPDIQAPGYTTMLGSEGFSDRITVYWQPNTETDLAGYQVYRSICDHGEPYISELPDGRMGCDFNLVGEVLRQEAEAQFADQGHIFFEDYTLPAGSPICHAYWVRAYDLSGNLYMTETGCPEHPEEYVCQKMYEEMPPPAPILAALKARSDGVLVEWIASPIQDLKAFHVYRARKESDPPEFVACIFLDGTTSDEPWAGTNPSCEDIPAVMDPDMARGSFLDSDVEPNQVYWYRVSALDWLGNESGGDDLKVLPEVSTFTYSTELPPAPEVQPAGASPPEGCGLLVRWDPAYHPGLEGFLVFRSTSARGPFRQVSSRLRDNQFADQSALRETDYWYRVQAISRRGKLSEPSAPVKHRYE